MMSERKRVKVGERAGAVQSSSVDTDTVRLFGYGVYTGDAIPQNDDVQMWGIPLRALQMSCPRIELDNGEVVWGCECYWGSEEEVTGFVAKFKKVVMVKPSEDRAENPKLSDQELKDLEADIDRQRQEAKEFVELNLPVAQQEPPQTP